MNIKQLLSFIFVAVPLAASAQGIEINEENFPDENFRNYLLEQWYGEDKIITEEEIGKIDRIEVGNYSKKYNIRSLKGIEFFTALTFLDCTANSLVLLDVSHNTALTELSCTDNQLTSLDVSKNILLLYLDCVFNDLTSLDVSNNTALTMLRCNNNLLTSLDVSNNTALTSLSCYGNHIKGISMDAFINSLPINEGDEEHKLSIHYYLNEANVCTYDQVAKIIEKGWIPCEWTGGKYYEGCEAPTSFTVSVGTEGLSTYCPAFDMDFSNAKEIEAYKASVSGINLYLDKVTSVAAGEGVLLRSINGGEAKEVLPIKATEKNEGNEFAGVLEAKVLQEKEGNVTNFILSKKNGETGFYKANKNPIAAWKAYLPVTNYDPTAETKGFNLIFRDPTTGIEEIETLPYAEEDAIYTLSGIRVTNPTKGIYIRNGKKVVVK